MKKPFVINCSVVEDKKKEFSERDYNLQLLNLTNIESAAMMTASYSNPPGYMIKTDKGDTALILKSSVEPSRLEVGQHIRIHRIPVAGIFYKDIMEIPGKEEEKHIEVRWYNLS